jgi:hypothetical protein
METAYQLLTASLLTAQMLQAGCDDRVHTYIPFIPPGTCTYYLYVLYGTRFLGRAEQPYRYWCLRTNLEVVPSNFVSSLWIAFK